MPNNPYLGNDKLIHVPCDWKGPGGLIEANKDFIWDTGASFSAVTPANARGKGLTFTGVTVSGTHAGPVATPNWGGGTMTFNVRKADGTAATIDCSTIVGESQMNILGQDQMDNRVAFGGEAPVIVEGLTPPAEKP
jgi:hypothetical protein